MPSKIYNHPSKKAFRKVLREAHIAPKPSSGIRSRIASLARNFADKLALVRTLSISIVRLRGWSWNWMALRISLRARDEYQENRTKYLEEQGLTVLRFENRLLWHDIEAVLDTIKRHLEKSRR